MKSPAVDSCAPYAVCPAPGASPRRLDLASDPPSAPCLGARPPSRAPPMLAFGDAAMWRRRRTSARDDATARRDRARERARPASSRTRAREDDARRARVRGEMATKVQRIMTQPIVRFDATRRRARRRDRDATATRDATAPRRDRDARLDASATSTGRARTRIREFL